MGWYDDAMGAVGLGGDDYQNPADSASPYLEAIPGYVDKYMNPYIDMGQTAGGIAQNQYAQMASDPTGYYNSIYDSYNQSDYEKYMSDQLAKTQQNTAAAGGFSGTQNDVNQQMTTQNALLSQDWNKYLEQVMGIQGGGLQGEQKMYNTGYNASTNALQGMTGYANSMAGLNYKGTQNQNAYNQSQNDAMLKTMTTGASMFI
jgi:hypothetical protein